MFTAKYLVAEIVPEIKGFNKTEFMNDCQLATAYDMVKVIIIKYLLSILNWSFAKIHFQRMIASWLLGVSHLSLAVNSSINFLIYFSTGKVLYLLMTRSRYILNS